MNYGFNVANMTIDLRSDTVTRPTPPMLEAMLSALVGDDVFGEDPSTNLLEKIAADLFKMEGALFCPSGTMSNQIAIRCHTAPGDEVICEQNAHVYIYEGGGIASNSGAQVRAITGNYGRINADQLIACINPDDVHRAHSSLICLENTSNRGGGSCYDFNEILKISEFCRSRHLNLHLDGARLFNALVAKKESPAMYGQIFDSISICLNKGLGCPIGSILMGKAEFIRKARRVRKVFGGGMRQAGYMAAAGIYALNHHITRLREDHSHAARIAEALSEKNFVKSIFPVETNLIIFDLHAPLTAKGLTDELRKHDILSIPIAENQVRFVTHLDISSEMVEKVVGVIRQL